MKSKPKAIHPNQFCTSLSTSSLCSCCSSEHFKWLNLYKKVCQDFFVFSNTNSIQEKKNLIQAYIAISTKVIIYILLYVITVKDIYTYIKIRIYIQAVEDSQDHPVQSSWFCQIRKKIELIFLSLQLPVMLILVHTKATK